ncbi:hypothetical protein [Niveispirillum cyanobacteriorum]|uniref:Uncharacterized protein n=1 Tax=Niveispirillum cyanobacteriorum TaxID=1612173 RepID=A0A2K9NBR9_9PROT|nr:hypothetical protein [Niveispirillum cyanobacteriorum]AUN29625.1 hypothetical protein C0V82_04830 [Niveispirillum cyanobacteriorum]GGE62630.1 hypothetical protein GCM10011317_20070 [Niveispirillum cyanobacteriorum]
MKYHPEALEPIVAFLRGIGIGVEFGPGAQNGFLPGVNIHAGVIHVDPETLVGPGDLLHEAGHMAVLPKRYRSGLGSDLDADMHRLIAEEVGPGIPDDAILAVPKQQGEFMAQAWSYAAALHIGVPPDCIFFPGSYKHDDYEGVHPMQAWIESGTHYGPAALARVGMTGPAGIFAMMGGGNGLPPYPVMSRWVQD